MEMNLTVADKIELASSESSDDLFYFARRRQLLKHPEVMARMVLLKAKVCPERYSSVLFYILMFDIKCSINQLIGS